MPTKIFTESFLSTMPRENYIESKNVGITSSKNTSTKTLAFTYKNMSRIEACFAKIRVSYVQGWQHRYFENKKKCCLLTWMVSNYVFFSFDCWKVTRAEKNLKSYILYEDESIFCHIFWGKFAPFKQNYLALRIECAEEVVKPTTPTTL